MNQFRYVNFVNVDFPGKQFAWLNPNVKKKSQWNTTSTCNETYVHLINPLSFALIEYHDAGGYKFCLLNFQ